MQSAPPELIAVDVGNSRIKFGRFARGTASPLPEPIEVFDLPIADRNGNFDATRLHNWCDEKGANRSTWLVASVFRTAMHRLIGELNDWAAGSNCGCAIREVTLLDVPLRIAVDEPARVGIDRLLAAAAADRLRQRDRPAIIIDLGTAITVDLLQADGVFAGGTILPGLAMSARALAEQTDALPHISLERLEKPPNVPAKSTRAAIEAGLYWGTVGAIREIVAQLSAGLPAAPQVFLTGGGSPQVAEVLATNVNWSARHVPHLVLSGITLVDK
jgi:type III pantothenate kinase